MSAELRITEHWRPVRSTRNGERYTVYWHARGVLVDGDRELRVRLAVGRTTQAAGTRWNWSVYDATKPNGGQPKLATAGQLETYGQVQVARRACERAAARVPFL